MSTIETKSPDDGVAMADPLAGERQVFEPHKVGLPPLGPYLRELWRRREFAVEMARNQLRARQYGTLFGQIWMILDPLLLAGVYFVLIDIIRRGHRPEDYITHLMAGIFAYHFVSHSVRGAVKSVVSSGRLILNSAFPRLLLPLSAVMVGFMRFLPTVPIYMIVHVVTGRPIGPDLLWVLPIFALLGLVAAGVAMIVAAVQVYFRDLASFVPYAIRVWLYASPVLYFANDLPERYQVLIAINPIGKLLTAWSDVLYSGVAPTASDLGIGAAWGVVLCVGGALFFMSREREFAVRL